MKPQNHLTRALAALILLIIGLIHPLDSLAEHGRRSAKADLSRLVVLGDSLLAGYQNGSLMGSQQTHGIAALIAQQAGVSIKLPLIAEPGIPNVLTLISVGPPLQIAPAPGTSSGRIDLYTQPM